MTTAVSNPKRKTTSGTRSWEKNIAQPVDARQPAGSEPASLNRIY
jgi:hypothetical protein